MTALLGWRAAGYPIFLVLAGLVFWEDVTPATLGRDERRQRRNHRRIAPGPVHERPIVCRPAEAHRSTGPLNRKASLTDQVSNDLPPFSRP